MTIKELRTGQVVTFYDRNKAARVGLVVAVGRIAVHVAHMRGATAVTRTAMDPLTVIRVHPEFTPRKARAYARKLLLWGGRGASKAARTSLRAFLTQDGSARGGAA